MQFTVLASVDSWYFRDLRRAAGSQHRLVPVSFNDLRSYVDFQQGISLRAGSIDIAQQDGLIVRSMPPGSLEQVIFRMDVLGQLHFTGHFVLNPPRALEVAVDKYLALIRLREAGLRIPRTFVCQTVDDAVSAFERLGRDAVIKPIFGSEGRGITRLTDEALALRAFKMLVQLNSVIYLQEFIDHGGYDLRLLAIGRRIFGMRRRNAADWRTNVSRGAQTEAIKCTDQLRDITYRAADAIEAPLLGVDLLTDKAGELFAIEVNAVPGWKALAGTLREDIAAHVLQLLAEHSGSQ